MDIIVEHDCPDFENRLRYVFNFIQNHPLAAGKVTFHFDAGNEGFIKLGYFSTERKSETFDFFIPAQRHFFPGLTSFQNLSNQSLELYANQYEFWDFKLYAVETEPYPPRSFLSEKQFGFDIFETLFFHISRFEEHVCGESQKDQHGRMLAEAQFLVKNQLEKIPVVDHLVYCFLEAIGAEPSKLPTKKRLTFDVDLMFRFAGLPPFRSTLKYAFRRPAAVAKVWREYFRTKTGQTNDPYFNFDWMLQERPGTEQVIYFLTGGQSKYDKPFPVVDDAFMQVVRLAKERGLSVGIHPSYNSWDSQKIMGAEKAKLEKILGENITQNRQHFLHYSFEKTSLILEKLGIEEDSSLGFSDRIGFRCGTGFPYFPYNFNEERPWRFLEVPLVVMDVALMREAGFGGEKVKELWGGFLENNPHFTQITFNFHNSRFFDAGLEGVDLEGLFNQLKG